MVEKDEPLWSAETCAAYMGGISRRQFLERVACQPSFPRPFELGRKLRCWYPEEVREWVYRNRVKKAA